jgi:hypothetical protein
MVAKCCKRPAHLDSPIVVLCMYSLPEAIPSVPSGLGGEAAEWRRGRKGEREKVVAVLVVLFHSFVDAERLRRTPRDPIGH